MNQNGFAALSAPFAYAAPLSNMEPATWRRLPITVAAMICRFLRSAKQLALAPALTAVVVAAPVGSGSIDGIFTNPSPACIGAADTSTTYGTLCSGTGTSTFQWGSTFFMSVPSTTGPGEFVFTGGVFDNISQHQTFVAGLVYYHNGTIARGTGVDSVELRMTSSSATAEFQNQVLTELIQIFETPNVADPLASADFIFFPNRPELGSFRVLEGVSATVEILAEFGSLDLIGFGNVVLDPANPDSNPANGFVASSIEPYPEPGTALLLASGILALLLRYNVRKLRAWVGK